MTYQPLFAAQTVLYLSLLYASPTAHAAPPLRDRTAVFMTADDPPSDQKISQWIREGGLPANHTVIQINPYNGVEAGYSVLNQGAILGVYIGGPETQETPEGYAQRLHMSVRDRIDEAVQVAKFYDNWAKAHGKPKGVSYFEIDFNNGGAPENIPYMKQIFQRLDAAGLTAKLEFKNFDVKLTDRIMRDPYLFAHVAPYSFMEANEEDVLNPDGSHTHFALHKANNGYDEDYVIASEQAAARWCIT